MGRIASGGGGDQNREGGMLGQLRRIGRMDGLARGEKEVGSGGGGEISEGIAARGEG